MKTQSLKFKFITNDGRRVTYRAIVSDTEASKRPVYALTATTGSPHDLQEQRELERFLGRLKAAFALVGPIKATQVPSFHKSSPFFPSTDILFVAELVTVNAPGVFGINFEVDSTFPDVTQPAANADPGGSATLIWNGKILKWRKQIFKSGGNASLTAKVTCSRGAVKVSPWLAGHHIARHDPYHEARTPHTTKITIRNDNNGLRSDFTIHADFTL